MRAEVQEDWEGRGKPPEQVPPPLGIAFLVYSPNPILWILRSGETRGQEGRREEGERGRLRGLLSFQAPGEPDSCLQPGLFPGAGRARALGPAPSLSLPRRILGSGQGQGHLLPCLPPARFLLSSVAPVSH